MVTQLQDVDVYEEHTETTNMEYLIVLHTLNGRLFV